MCYFTAEQTLNLLLNISRAHFVARPTYLTYLLVVIGCYKHIVKQYKHDIYLPLVFLKQYSKK